MARKKDELYTGENDLGNGLYKVDIFTTQSDDLMITAKHISKIDNFVI